MNTIIQREIRTKRQGAKVGTCVMIGQEPVALVKQGKKIDTITLDEFASELYGKKVTCEVRPIN